MPVVKTTEDEVQSFRPSQADSSIVESFLDLEVVEICPKEKVLCKVKSLRTFYKLRTLEFHLPDLHVVRTEGAS